MLFGENVGSLYAESERCFHSGCRQSSVKHLVNHITAGSLSPISVRAPRYQSQFYSNILLVLFSLQTLPDDGLLPAVLLKGNMSWTTGFFRKKRLTDPIPSLFSFTGADFPLPQVNPRKHFLLMDDILPSYR